MAGSYTRWYRVGQIKATQNSKSIVGTNTYWLTAGLNPGDLFTTDNGNSFIEIASIEDDSHLTLASAYTSASVSAAAYAICRNFTAHLPSQIAADTAGLINDMARYWDQDTLTLKGESAYEIAKRLGKTTATEASWIDSLKGDSAYAVAKASGFTGTQAQWLESLKAAGEWSSARDRLTALETLTTNRTIANNAWAHKCIYRGKNLGSTITAEQSAAIRNGTFEDIFIGDYWKTTWRGNNVNFIIVDINYYWHNLLHWQYPAVRQNHVVVYTQGYGWIENAPYKADDDVSGGYIGSDVRNNTIPIVTAELADIFGADHLFYHPDYFCNSVNENGESGFVLEEQSCVEIPSWAMFYELSPYVSNPRNYANQSYLPEVFSLPRLTGGAYLCGTNPGHMYFRDCKNASKVVYGGSSPSIWYQDPSKCTLTRPIFTLY